MTTTINISPTKDTHILQNAASTNYGGLDLLSVGEHPAEPSANGRALIFFSFAAIPVGSVIISATLHLYHVSEDADNARTMHVTRLIRLWEEMEATWNSARGGTVWGTAGADATTDHDSTSLGSRSFSATEAAGWKTIDLTASVIQSIYNGTLTYEGFRLSMESALNDRHRFASREHATTTWRPFLEVIYAPPGGQLQVIMI